MILTLFRDAAARTAEQRDLSLEEIRTLATTTTAPTKDALLWIKLARFGDVRSPNGALRHNANVLEVSGIEGDYDGETIAPDEAANLLSAAGVRALIYTSPSHNPTRPRWRVLCPLSQVAPPSLRYDLIGRLNHVLGGVLSTESFTLSQAYYIGSTETGSPVHTLMTPGRALDLIDLPARYPERSRAAASPLVLPPPARGQAPDKHAQAALSAAADAFSRRGDVDRHSTVLRTTAALAPFVLSGHLDRADTIASLQEAMIADGRAPNDNEIESALDRACEWSTPYAPPTDGAEFGEDPLPPTRAGLRSRFIFPADCASSASRGYLIKHLLAPGDVAALIGPPSTGKSVLAPHIAYALAQGRPVFNLRTKPGRVLYCAAEDGAGMRQRVRALFNCHGDAPYFALAEIANLRDRAAAADLEAAVSDWNPTLLVIDTLGAAWAGLDENSSVDMGEVVALARRIAGSGCAVLLVHHTAKAGDGSPRGHSALNGTLDMCLALGDRATDGTIRVKLQKNRNGTPDREIAFRISVASLGPDEDGDPITAPIAAEVTPKRPSAPKLSPQQSIAWTEFLKIEAGSRPDSEGKRVVRTDEWRGACDDASLSTSVNPDSQRRTFMRALGDLYRLGFIVKSSDYVWRANGFHDLRTADRGRTVTGQRGGTNRTDRTDPLEGSVMSGVPGSEFIN